MEQPPEFRFTDLGEARVIGPPGTGKTRFLTKQIQFDAAQRGPQAVVALSHTNAAARTLIGRELAIPPENVGTVHAFAYRAIGKPPLVQDPELLAQFNENVHPRFRVDVASESRDTNDLEMRLGEGNDLLGEYERRRNMMVPQTPRTEQFATVWEDFKRQVGGVDFVDMLALALKEVDCCPGRPEVLIADEVQDSSKLQLSLLWKWGRQAEKVIFAGDGDQCVTGDTLVTMADGTERRIDALVQARSTEEVLCFDHDAGAIVARTIAGWHEVPLGGRQLAPVGPVCMTDDHPFFTLEGGYQTCKSVIDLNTVSVLYLKHGDPHTTRTGHLHRNHSGGWVDQSWQPDAAGSYPLRSGGGASRLPALEVQRTEQVGEDPSSLHSGGPGQPFRRDGKPLVQHGVAPRVHRAIRTVPPRWWAEAIAVGALRGRSLGPRACGVDHGRRIEQQRFPNTVNERLRVVRGRGGCSLLDPAGHGMRCLPNAARPGAGLRAPWIGSGGGEGSAVRAAVSGVQGQPARAQGQPSSSRLRSRPAQHRTDLRLLRGSMSSAERTLFRPDLPAPSIPRSHTPVAEETTSRKRGVHRRPQRSGESGGVHPMWGALHYPVRRRKAAHSVRELPAALGAEKPGEDEPVVYCIDVADHHNFFANGMLVHNCIYGFNGADPRVFLDNPAARQKVLSQSWRVPKAVHGWALDWIRKNRYREDVHYAPTDQAGSVEDVKVGWRTPDLFMPIVERAVEEGKTIMILTTCSYMLHPAIAELRSRGIPFSNPYRTKQGAWNPLGRGGDGSTVARLRSFFRRWVGAGTWTGNELRAWLEMTSGVVRRGYKSRLAELLADDLPVNNAAMVELLTPEAGEVLLDPLTGAPEAAQWLRDRLMKPRRNVGEYALQVAERWGAPALDSKPTVMVGTIHSVKGGEADRVIMFPDLSQAGFEQWQDLDGREEMRRVFYVGATRAREALYLGQPTSKCAVPWR